MFNEPLDVFLADMGVPCSFAGQKFTGIFDMPDTQLSMGSASVQTTGYSLTVKTSTITDLAITQGTTIVVNGGVYLVRESNLLDDGSFTALVLYK